MGPTFKVDTTEFNRFLAGTVASSKRDAVTVINSRLLFVILKSIQMTAKANRAQIERELGQIGADQKFTKSGRIKSSRRVLREDSFAARIVNARRRDYAGPDFMLWGNALEEAARKLIAARVRSAAFIKSGWVGALRFIAPFVKGRKTSPDKDAKIFGRPKGYATPARPAQSLITATAENRALLTGGRFQSPGQHNPLPVAEAGLRKALASEQAEMTRHLREKLMQTAKQAGATVR